MLRYSVDVLALLKEKGYTTYRIRKENLITEKSLTAMRHGKPIHWTTIEKICELLDCQPNDFLEYVKDEQMESE